MLGQLVTVLLLAAAAPAPVARCPSPDAVAAELERLGTAAAVAAVGTPEIQVDGARMRVALRGLDGNVSGVREVAAPASCAERASVAAVLVSAWVGAWRTGSFPEGTRPPGVKAVGAGSSAPPDTALSAPIHSQPSALATPSDAPARAAHAPPPPSPAVAPVPGAASSAAATLAPGATRTVPAPASPPSPARAADRTAQRAAPAGQPARKTMVELGGFGFGIHDGDAGAFGGGIQAGYRFPHWLGIDAVFAGSGVRERAMVRGSAAYRLYSLGVGLDVRKQSGPVSGDLGVFPEVTLLSVDGRNLNPGRSVTRWGAAAAARLRLLLVLGPWRPFAFAGTSYALRAESLRLDDYPEQSITLSRWNLSLGLGLAYFFGAVTQGETNVRQPSLGLVE
jgi:hypothetical protein